MTFKDFSVSKKRRGLSSIVGALLFVVLMVSAFAVLGVALDSQTEIVDTGREVSTKELQKQQEKFTLNNIVQVPGEFLQVNLTNNGQNAAEMFTLIMTNKSAIAAPTQTFEIPSNTSFLAPGNDDPTNIVETLDLKMQTPISGPEFYEFKVISSLGTIKKLLIECKKIGIEASCGVSVPTVGSGALQAQLFLDGPNGINTKTSSVVMFVQNTGSSSVYNVSPTRDCLAMTTVLIGTGTFDPCVLDSPDPFPELLPGASALFKWDGISNAEIDDVFEFCNIGGGFEADLVTAVPDSNESCDLLTIIDPNDCGGCGPGGGDGGENLIILDDLLIRPSIFLTLPSPFGSASENDSTGIWGVNIANPTNSTMDVSKVSITAFAPGAQENTQVFDDVGGAINENISPPGAGMGSWNLDQENVAVWLNFANPITLEPYSNEFFALKVKPEKKQGAWESIIVQSSVFTTSGSFGKSGYQTSMFSPQFTDGEAPIANIYLTNVTDSKDKANILGYKQNIKNGTQQYFSVVFADLDLENDTYIKPGARVIVNVPRTWENVSVIPGNTTNIIINATQPSIQKHSDGTHQIIGLTDKILGNQTGPSTATLSFTALVPEKEFENMHIMYILGFGLTEDDYIVGPQQEAVLHVIGNVTGYIP